MIIYSFYDIHLLIVMNYTLHQLKVFIKIVELRSVTRASEELHLSQPAVSIQLKKLQDQFEIPLTEVVGRQLYITNFGQRIAELGKNVLNEAEEIRFTTNAFKGLLTGELKISVVSTAKYVIPYFLEGFMSQHPEVDIKIDVSNKQKVIEGLNSNESDFSLVSVLPKNVEVKTLELLENELVLVGQSEFKDLVVNKKTLPELTLIFREEGSATRAAMEGFLNKQKIEGYKRMELVSNEAVKQAVLAGIGFSVMPIIGLKNELANKSLHVFPIQGLPIKTNWNLVYQKNKRLSPSATALLQYIEDHRGSILERYF